MKKKSPKKIIMISLISILGIILIGIGGIFAYSRYMYSKMETVDIDREDVLNGNEKKPESDNIINIGLFGVDRTDGDDGLSDSNMILTLNKNTNEIKLSSIMRDSLVDIPGHGMMILNNATLAGRSELMLKTLNKNFGLDLDTFVSVNLNTLPKIIDKLGGVEMNITDEEFKYINNYIKDLNKKNSTDVALIKSSGKQHLNGTQATAYARIRYTAGSDFKRTERQRDLFTAIAKKISTLSLNELYSFVNESLDLVTTNLTYSEIFSIGTTLLDMDLSNIKQNRFPNDGDFKSGSIDGEYGLILDMEETSKKIQEFIYK